jgi:uncharacterized protein involved in exopolysaccharide biosynthesis
MQQQEDNLLGVLQTLFRHLRFIISVCVIVGIGSIIIALLLPVYYQSSTVFLSASPDLLTERGLFGTTTRDPQPFGTNNDNDRLLTIAESDELMAYLIDEFDLYDHYDMDSTGAKSAYYIREQLRGLYEVQKTKRDAIQLSVEDKEPEIAAAMANAARDKIDDINLQLAKNMQGKQIITFEQNIVQKQEKLNELSDSLQATRSRYRIYNTESQSETLSDLMTTREARLTAYRSRLESNTTTRGRDTLRTAIAALEQEVANLDSQLQQFNRGMPRITALEGEYEQAVKQFSFDKERLKQLQAAYYADVSSIILVENAEVPIVKSRPMRSLLVIGSVLAAFIFSVLGVLLYDNYKSVQWQRIWK